MFRELLIHLGLVYDPRFALKPSEQHAPAPAAPKPPRPIQVKYTKSAHVPYKENTAETDPKAGVFTIDVMTTQEAVKGGVSELTKIELQSIEQQRIATKLKLPVELCQEVKNKLCKGLSIKQIEKDFKGVRGASARTIAAISSAINQAKK